MKTTLFSFILFCSLLVAKAQTPISGSVEWMPTPEKLVETNVEKREKFSDALFIAHPKIVQKEDPIFPFSAARARISGGIRLFALIDEKGRVMKVQIVESEPKDVFDESAKSAIKKWIFESQTLNKKPTQYVVDYIFIYRSS